ncbi:hypothetical protein AC579_3850 [Lecanosticta acicola]|uniref:DNA endonuclease activator Ctp1 C-terminal domain-containing protein n=1 Tax=Lecanosticta acicola TaxID=111012 RepID=A0AAI8YTT5_9PEZI|nr:hypothetical protein AC579_3850 [Lecanosticta acicola]
MAGHIYHDHEPTLQDAMSTIARQAIRISQLEANNAALRAQLESTAQAYGSSRSQVNDPPAYTPAPGSASRNMTDDNQGQEISGKTGGSADLMAQHEELKARHSRLESEHAECGPRIEKYREKAREAKRRCQEWKDWREKRIKEGKIQDENGLHLTPQEGSRIDTPGRVAAHAVAPAAGMEETAAGTDIVSSRAATAAISSDLPSSPPKSSSVAALPRVTSSQTTADDVSEPNRSFAGPKSFQSSDPVVVSARAVKRKAAAAPTSELSAQRVKIKEEPNSPGTAIELRSDDYSSPRRNSRRLFSTETTDLDASGPHMITPRRRDFPINRGPRATSEEAVRAAPRLTRAVSSYSDGDLASEIGVQSDLKMELPSTSRQIDIGRSELEPVKRLQGQQNRWSDSALQPLEINVPNRPRRHNHWSASKSKRRRTGSKGHIALLSEGGDEESQSAPNHDERHETATEDATDGRRLDDLLNKRSPEKTPTFVRQPLEKRIDGAKLGKFPHLPTPISAVKQPPNSAKPKVKAMLPWILATPVSAAKRPSPVKRKSLAKQPVDQGEHPPGVEPDHEPLRIRGLDRLGLDDFKINPRYMGTDFAFADTLRKRDERRHLIASNQPELDKAIAMGDAASMSGKTDAQALATFLGSGWEDVMGGYGPAQRKDIVAQAHVHCFTMQHGKQRQAFQRRSTPPGFWETGFPTTQESAQNRARAHEMERQQVAERWREAMRENGRWMFRDE